MKIAIPVAEGRLAMHFGHCQEFRIIEVDTTTNKILGGSSEVPPPHEPGVLPKWLHEKGVNVIIAGGMGNRAQGLFAENGIEFAHRNVTVYLPPENQGKGTGEGAQKDNSGDQPDKKIAEAAAAAAAAAIQAEEDAKKKLEPQKK